MHMPHDCIQHRHYVNFVIWRFARGCLRDTSARACHHDIRIKVVNILWHAYIDALQFAHSLDWVHRLDSGRGDA